MRILTSILTLAAVALVLVGVASAQSLPPNITATLVNVDVPIGKTIHIDYVTPRHHNGRYIYTIASLFSGYTPIGYNYLLPLSPPFYLMGINMVAANKAKYGFPIPKDPTLVGVKVYLAGLVLDGTKIGTGVSNHVLCTIRQEDWPLP